MSENPGEREQESKPEERGEQASAPGSQEQGQQPGWVGGDAAPEDPEQLRKFDEEANTSKSADPGTGFVRIIKMVSPLVEKTTIDLDACRNVVGRLLSDQEVRVAEEVKAKQQELASQPYKPPHPITAYRNATPCGAKWDDMSGTDQFRVCGRCKLFVYDFRDMELAAAEHLVFQREAKEAKKFYMRKDGRFLTSDCPVGVQSGKQIAFAMLAVLLVVGGAIALSMQAPPPEPAKTEAQQPVPENPLPVPAPENPDKSVGFQPDPNSAQTAQTPALVTGPIQAPPAEIEVKPYFNPPEPPPGGWPSKDNPQPAGWPSMTPPPGGWQKKPSTPEEWDKLRQQVFGTKATPKSQFPQEPDMDASGQPATPEGSSP